MVTMIGNLLVLGFLALLSFAQARADLPQLKLPWGTWQATVYEKDPKIYLFQNVRFGGEPERFSAPSYPKWVDDSLQESTKSISCIQNDITQMRKPPGGRTPIGKKPRDANVVETEDCLFLDIYAPVSAFEPGADPMPVVVWIHGGAFAFGSKIQSGPLYTGQSIIAASEYKTIFIAGNYRMGAFGWLAGSYMEKHGQPNAGLHDQALLFQWVQDHIGQVGGDKNSVSAWGESAGASSILHHLVREDGKRDPLFKTFAAQSPAFEWAWNNSRDGTLDNIYRNFSKLAGCGFEYDIDCLRKTNIEKLRRANDELFNVIRQTGLFPVGPAVDGDWIRSIPTVSISEGKIWDGIDAAIISHVANEALLFLPKNIDSQAAFDRFLEEFLPGDVLEKERESIRKQYNCEKSFNGNFTLCIAEVVRDSSFTCNTRDLFDAYPDRSYMMKYSFTNGSTAVHATDLIPLFMNSKEEAKDLVLPILKDNMLADAYAGLLDEVVRKRYQNYFASFALSGSPNSLSSQLEWVLADGDGDKLYSVMTVDLSLLPWKLMSDDQNTKSACSFWTKLAKEIVRIRSDTDDQGEPLRLKLPQGFDEL